MKLSAGLLLFRFVNHQLEVFLVHPGGPFWKNKDEGAWSIPKGEFSIEEDPLKAAIREFEEETGAKVSGKFIPLDAVKLKGGKIVHAWALEKDIDASSIVSNTFSMEWPPRSGKQIEIPEVDRAEWFTLPRARIKINAGQVPLLDQLVEKTKATT
ncbi:MAG: NUDIX domain-containing protein [Chitinophagaceae bacterium]|nr:NUDIX domain-containing protein [Chitinophagaceae bacterium]